MVLCRTKTLKHVITRNFHAFLHEQACVIFSYQGNKNTAKIREIVIFSLRKQLPVVHLQHSMTSLVLSSIGNDCISSMDIGFMLDSSGSLRDQYPQIKAFIKNFASSLAVSKEVVHVGVVTFSFYATLSIKFSDFVNKADFKEAVEEIPFMGSTTRIDRALKVVNEDLFSESNGARRDVTKMLILLTDGSQTKDADAVDPGKLAKLLRQRGIHILSVGIGEDVDIDELTHIAGSPDRVYTTADFDQLIEGNFIKKVVYKSCETGRFDCLRLIVKNTINYNHTGGVSRKRDLKWLIKL